MWEDQRLIPADWLAAPLEPTMCSLAQLKAQRLEGCANPECLILLFMYLTPPLLLSSGFPHADRGVGARPD